MTMWSEIPGEEYARIFHSTQGTFYNGVTSKLHLFEEGRVINFGAGIGTLALLAYEERIRMGVVGVEPSDLFRKSIETAAVLSKEGVVKYKAIKRTMQREIEAQESLDSLEDQPTYNGMTFLNSAHEIAKSIGSKEGFFDYLGRALKYLDYGGHLLIGDPMWGEELIDRVRDAEDPNEHPDFRLTREALDHWFRHSHPWEEYFTPEELVGAVPNLSLVGHDLYPSMEVQGWMQERGYQGEPTHVLNLMVFQKD